MSVKRDKQFNLNKITYVDHKHIEMDRVLTMLFPRLRYDGHASRRAPRKSDLSIDDFIRDFLKHDEIIINTAKRISQNPSYLQSFLSTGTILKEWAPELDRDQFDLLQELAIETKLNENQLGIWFRGLSTDKNNIEILAKWIETDLMDVVNRGKPNQAIASPRPLHGNTYKFRNAKHTRDYGAAEQIYWMLYHARAGKGQSVRDELKKFFFPGIDLITDRYDPRVSVDVETQALLHLDQQVKEDRQDPRKPDSFPPLCIGQADILADDILRLLAYQDHMPRSVLVESLKILLAFHLGLYHLKLLKLLPSVVAKRQFDNNCVYGKCPIVTSNNMSMHSCPYQIGLLVEMGDPNNKHMLSLAERSADLHYRRIPDYVNAHFAVVKLDEMAEYLEKINKIPFPPSGFFSVADSLTLLGESFAQARENYFSGRLVNLIEDITGPDGLPSEIKSITDLSLTNYETFIEIIVTLRSSFHRRYIVECLDSFFLKNTDSCLLRQAKAHGSSRYFSLGSRLLEVLLQIAVLSPDGTRFHTQDMRIDDLLSFLRLRYGIFIDRFPEFEDNTKPSILDQQALRKNVDAFKNRLREIGYFQDLSDAQLTQTVTSRYVIS
jgi:hypothetical protein